MAVTKPEFIQEAETAWNTTTSPKSAGPASVQVGDVLVQVGGAEGQLTSIIPSGGPEWTSRQVVSAASRSFASAYTGIVGKAESLTVTLTREGSSSIHWGGNVLTFRKSEGVGASAKGESEGAPSLEITTTQDNSAVVVIVTDWNAKSGTRTWRTVNGTTPTEANGFERTYVQDGSRYTVYAAYYPDVGASGAKTVGLTAPTGQKFSIIAVEVKGTKEGGTTYNDSGSGTVSLSGSGSESASAADTGAGAIATGGVGAESASASDAASGAISLAGSGTESVAYTDASSGTVSLLGSGVEDYRPTYTDSGTGTISLGGSGSESASVEDAGTSSLGLSGSGVEGHEVTGSGSGTIELTGEGVESWSSASNYDDAGSGELTLSGSGVESFSYTDAGSGALSLFGEGVESAAAADSSTGVIEVLGGGSESVEWVDSAEGLIVLSGSGQELWSTDGSRIGTATGGASRVASAAAASRSGSARAGSSPTATARSEAP